MLINVVISIPLEQGGVFRLQGGVFALFINMLIGHFPILCLVREANSGVVQILINCVISIAEKDVAILYKRGE